MPGKHQRIQQILKSIIPHQSYRELRSGQYHSLPQIDEHETQIGWNISHQISACDYNKRIKAMIFLKNNLGNLQNILKLRIARIGYFFKLNNTILNSFSVVCDRSVESFIISMDLRVWNITKVGIRFHLLK